MRVQLSSLMAVTAILTTTSSLADNLKLTPTTTAAAIQKSVPGGDPEDLSYTGNRLMITTSADKSEASMKFGTLYGISNMSVLVKVPLAKGSTSATVHATDAFAKGSSIEFNYQRYLSNLDSTTIPKDNAINSAANFRSLCKKQPAIFGYTDGSKCTSKIDTLVGKYQAGKDLDNEGKALVSTIANVLKEGYGYYGVTAKAGLQENKYLLPSSLSTETEQYHPWSTGVYLGYIKPRFAAVTLKYEYQQAYNSQDPANLCPTTPATDGFLHCITAEAGEPNKSVNRNLSLTVKGPIIANKLAYSATYTRNLEADTGTASIPIYFFPNADGDLNGGISASWSESELEWTYGIFVGSAFSLF